MFCGCEKVDVPVLFADVSPNADGSVPAKGENLPPEPALNAPPDLPRAVVAQEMGVTQGGVRLPGCVGVAI